MLGSLFRRVLPYLTTASKHVGKIALQTGANVLTDTATGKSFQGSLRNRLQESGSQLKQDAINEVKKKINMQTGSGRKKRKRKTTPQNQKQKKAKLQSIKRSKSKNVVRSQKTTKRRTFQDIFGSRP